MSEIYVRNQQYNGNVINEKGEYEACTFVGCDFTNQNISGYQFTDCTFTSCNLSMVKLLKSAWRNCTFTDCKMLGLRFDTCNEIGLSFLFNGCILNHSSFYLLKIKKTTFNHCQLHGTDFTKTDLTGSTFNGCDLTDALFDQTNLSGVNFTTASHYRINPANNIMAKAKFSSSGLAGLLMQHDLIIE